MTTIDDRRAPYEAQAKQPGRFENQPAYVPYFWDAFLDGLADELPDGTLAFEVDDQDRLLFPELTQVRVFLREQSDGSMVLVDGPGTDELLGPKTGAEATGVPGWGIPGQKS